MTELSLRLPVIRRKQKEIFAGAAFLTAFVTLTLGVYLFLSDYVGVDWFYVYFPAARNILSLKSPYVYTYYNPPWGLLPLLPLALLPPKLGFAINFSLGLWVTGFVAYRLGAKPLLCILLAFSYPVLFMAMYGQIDWIVFLGFLLPPQAGLFFVLLKPQTSIGIVIFWLIGALREGGIKKAVLTFLPVTAAMGFSFMVYGNWIPGGTLFNVSEVNSSFWPQSIPIGLVLLVAAIRSRRMNLAIAASPFLSPYVVAHSWGTVLIALSPMPHEMIAAIVGTWILRIMTGQFLY